MSEDKATCRPDPQRRELVAGAAAALAASSAMATTNANATPMAAATTLVEGMLIAEENGMVGDGATDNKAAFERLIDRAIAEQKPIVFTTGGVFYFRDRIAREIKGALRLTGLAGATIAMSRPWGANTLDLTAERRLVDARLANDMAPGAQSFELTLGSAVKPGDVIYLKTQTQVCRTYPRYFKCHASVVASVDGQVVQMRDPTSFHFDADETLVDVFAPTTVVCEGLNFHHRDHGAKMEWRHMIAPIFADCAIVGEVKDPTSFGLVVTGCIDFRARNLDLEHLTYAISIGNGSRNSRLEMVRSAETRHPIDPHSWAHGVYVNDLVGLDNWQTINAHPAFETHYENVIERSASDAGTSLRTIGGGVRGATLHSKTGGRASGVSRIELLDEYRYLEEAAYLTFEDVDAPSMVFGANECKRLTIKNCRFAEILVDGHSNRVAEAVISGTTALDDTRRLKKIASGEPLELKPNLQTVDGRTFEFLDVRSNVNLGHDPVLRYWAWVGEAARASFGGVIETPLRFCHHVANSEPSARIGRMTFMAATEDGFPFAQSFDFAIDAAARIKFEAVEPARPQASIELRDIANVRLLTPQDRRGFDCVLRFARQDGGRAAARFRVHVEETRLA